jgi:MoxR-like ATPase
MSIIDDFKKWLSGNKNKKETDDKYISCLKQSAKWGLTGDIGVFQYTSLEDLKPLMEKLRKAISDSRIGNDYKRNFHSALNFYSEFLKENETSYIDIFSDDVKSNIPGFEFKWEYICKGGKESPTYINLKKAVFVSGEKETPRMFSKGEQKHTGIVLARLAIQVFENDLDKLTEEQRRSLKIDGSDYSIGLWNDKEAQLLKWGNTHNARKKPPTKYVADMYLGNPYPSTKDAKYYFYNVGLYDSMCTAQNLLKMFGKPGDHFRIEVTQGKSNENNETIIVDSKTFDTLDTNSMDNTTETNLLEAYSGKGENVIFYGVPGCGKSHSIEGRIAKEAGETEPETIRTVFHPDYTYSDFVGQILPKLNDKKVVYEFVPGPFTEALELANQIVKTPVFLIIEEINRGNASAIFGDIFQLLDREESGESKYEIDNKDISDEKVKIPSNLYIYATMNTSDQNVFTLDTAFQRRFEMELVRNIFDDNQNWEIPETGVTWKMFAEEVNKLLTKQDAVMSSEDKSLGAWFVKDGITKSRFANKVLKYLWDDAFKFDRAAFFDVGKYGVLQEILDEFDKTGFERILADAQGLREITETAKSYNETQLGGDENAPDEN